MHVNNDRGTTTTRQPSHRAPAMVNVSDRESPLPNRLPKSTCTSQIMRTSRPSSRKYRHASSFQLSRQRSVPIEKAGVQAILASIKTSGKRGNDARYASRLCGRAPKDMTNPMLQASPFFRLFYAPNVDPYRRFLDRAADPLEKSNSSQP